VIGLLNEQNGVEAMSCPYEVESSLSAVIEVCLDEMDR
jgi:hypothetical protein